MAFAPRPLESKESPELHALLASSIHDMKNSVSMLLSGLHKALSESPPDALPAHAELTHMTYEAGRINSNLMQLLTLYKLDGELYPFQPDDLNVADFLQLAGDQQMLFAPYQTIQVEIDCDPNLYWYFDEDLMLSVVSHAIGNATRYTNGKIRLAAHKTEQRLEISVEDNGPGYPVEMIEQTGFSAHRGDASQHGTGLGLYFAHMIAQLHKNRGKEGFLRLENGGPLGGSRFVITLP